MTKRYRGHMLILEHERDERGITAIRYDITSDTGQGAAVGHYGWIYDLRSLSAAAREVARIVDNAIAGDEMRVAAGMVC